MACVAVGGTFEPLHDGHKALLEKACDLSKGGELLIGLTSDEMARQRFREVLDYEARLSAVKEYVESLGINPIIVELKDPYGPTVYEDFDYLVVSPETLPVGLEINEIRREKGLKPIKIVKIEYVLAKDGRPISSTRIKLGEIDEHGNLLNNR